MQSLVARVSILPLNFRAFEVGDDLFYVNGRRDIDREERVGSPLIEAFLFIQGLERFVVFVTNDSDRSVTRLRDDLLEDGMLIFARFNRFDHILPRDVVHVKRMIIDSVQIVA